MVDAFWVLKLPGQLNIVKYGVPVSARYTVEFLIFETKMYKGEGGANRII